MTNTMTIITCPFCDWSAAYMTDETERATRLNNELSAHLASHQ